jgi:predicted amidohydrolase
MLPRVAYESLHVVAVEVPATFDRTDRAFAFVEQGLRGLGPGALAVLPETCITGYVSPEGHFDLTRFAEPIDGPTATRFSGLASLHSVWLVCPLVERRDGRVFNTTLVLDPRGGLVARYAKRHPWYPEAWATPGNEPFTCFDVDGVTFALATCFDIHFLEECPDVWPRADALLFSSAWVDEDGGDARASLLRDVARDRSLVVVNANWGRGNPSIAGQGGSMIVDADGSIRTRARASREIARVSVHLSKRDDTLMASAFTCEQTQRQQDT